MNQFSLYMNSYKFSTRYEHSIDHALTLKLHRYKMDFVSLLMSQLLKKTLEAT